MRSSVATLLLLVIAAAIVAVGALGPAAVVAGRPTAAAPELVSVAAHTHAGVTAQSTAEAEALQHQLAETDSTERMANGVQAASVSISRAHQYGEIIHVPLARNALKDAPAVLMNMALRQRMDDDGVSSLLETASKDVPLTQEVLREKHLATYYGVVSIGDTKFRILFDTGSCEFWVPSTTCPMERCKKHTQYPIDNKSTSRFMARNRLNIQYLSGRVSGDMIYENVKAGDVVVHRQIVGVADHVDIVLLDDVIWDGILGLAYPNKVLARKGVVPFFDNVIRSGALKKRGLSNQFGYYIDDSHGSVTFGGVDCSLLGPHVSSHGCVKHFGFVPVSERTYWTIRINEISAKYPGKAPIRSKCGRQGCKAIVDTGTYLLYGPGRLVRKMLKPGRFAGCKSYQNLPDFTFDFKVGSGSPAVRLTLRPIDYVLKFSNEGKEECVTGISPDRDTMWTLGQVFLRSFYTVFDRDLNRIGFARLPRTKFQAINAHEDADAQAFVESDSSAVLNLGELTGDQQKEVMWAEHQTESELAAEEADQAEDEQDTEAEADTDADEGQDQDEQDAEEEDEAEQQDA